MHNQYKEKKLMLDQDMDVVRSPSDFNQPCYLC